MQALPYLNGEFTFLLRKCRILFIRKFDL